MTSSPLSFRQRVWLEGHNPVVLFRGRTLTGTTYFAYVEMTRQEYESLARNPSGYQEPEKHGRVILSGQGLPGKEQMRHMEKHYEFDHSSINW